MTVNKTYAVDDNPKMNRGFRQMDPEVHREIARAGGRAAHEKGTAHEYTSETGKIAGRKGGLKIAATKGTEYFREIGRKGGNAARAKALAARDAAKENPS